MPFSYDPNGNLIGLTTVTPPQSPQFINSPGSGTYTPSIGLAYFTVSVIGGGGGGGRCGGTVVTESGGGGGGGSIFAVLSPPIQTSYSYTVGSGGNGGTLIIPATSGGNSVFNCGTGSLTGFGGFGAATCSDAVPQGAGGIGGGASNTSGLPTIFLANGSNGVTGSANPFVGGCGGNPTIFTSNGPVVSQASGRYKYVNGVGENGIMNGGGGGGGRAAAVSGFDGGQGVQGFISITEYF